MRTPVAAAAAVTMVVLAAGCGDGGTGGGTPSPSRGQAAEGKAIFTAHCGGCHTLADARTTAVVGPNLDELKPAKALVVAQVTNGGIAMPSFSDNLSAGHSLTDAQIQAVAEYVSSAAGR